MTDVVPVATAGLMERMAGMEAAVENMEKKLDGLADEWREHDEADRQRHAELTASIAALDKRHDRSVGQLHGKLDTFIARIDEREKARAARPEWPGLMPAVAAIPPSVWTWVLGVFGSVIAGWFALHGIDVKPPPVPLDVTAPATNPE